MNDCKSQLEANIREHEEATRRYERQLADHERKMKIITNGFAEAMAIYTAGMLIAYEMACIPERRRCWWRFR